MHEKVSGRSSGSDRLQFCRFPIRHAASVNPGESSVTAPTGRCAWALSFLLELAGGWLIAGPGFHLTITGYGSPASVPKTARCECRRKPQIPGRETDLRGMAWERGLDGLDPPQRTEEVTNGGRQQFRLFQGYEMAAALEVAPVLDVGEDTLDMLTGDTLDGLGGT